MSTTPNQPNEPNKYNFWGCFIILTPIILLFIYFNIYILKTTYNKDINALKIADSTNTTKIDSISPANRTNITLEDLSNLGDSFGMLNTLFSGFALIGILCTIWLQKKASDEQAKQFKTALEAQKKASDSELSAQKEALEIQKKASEIDRITNIIFNQTTKLDNLINICEFHTDKNIKRGIESFINANEILIFIKQEIFLYKKESINTNEYTFEKINSIENKTNNFFLSLIPQKITTDYELLDNILSKINCLSENEKDDLKSLYYHNLSQIIRDNINLIWFCIKEYQDFVDRVVKDFEAKSSPTGQEQLDFAVFKHHIKDFSNLFKIVTKTINTIKPKA